VHVPKWRPGEHLFVCDVCGFYTRSKDKRIRWDGLVVCPQDWEPRHSQDFVKAIEDEQQVDNPRPRQPQVFRDEGGTWSFSNDVGTFTPD
jgi:hypothetical protein